MPLVRNEYLIAFICSLCFVVLMISNNFIGTDPANFELIGVPPKDLIYPIAQALRVAGYDYDEVFERCVSVSNEWKYNAVGDSNLTNRFSQRYIRERTVPMRHKVLEDVLNPQPVAQKVTFL